MVRIIPKIPILPIPMDPKIPMDSDLPGSYLSGKIGSHLAAQYKNMVEFFMGKERTPRISTRPTPESNQNTGNRYIKGQ